MHGLEVRMHPARAHVVARHFLDGAERGLARTLAVQHHDEIARDAQHGVQAFLAGAQGGFTSPQLFRAQGLELAFVPTHHQQQSAAGQHGQQDRKTRHQLHEWPRRQDQFDRGAGHGGQRDTDEPAMG